MKKVLTILGLIAFATVNAQEKINYTVIKDDPSVLPKVVVNLDIFEMEVWKPKTDFGVNFGFGVWGHVEVPNIPLVAQYQFYRSYFEDAKLLISKDFPNTTHVQLGGLYMLSDNTKRKTISVGLDNQVVSSNRTTDSRGRTTENRTHELTSIKVPGNFRRQFGVRGGLTIRRSGIAFSDGLGEAGRFEPKPYEFASHNSTNLYAGLEVRNALNLVIQTDKYGRSTTTSKMSSWFVDAIFPVVNNFNHPSGDDVQQLMKDSLSGIPIGFRIGLQNSPVEKRDITGKKFGLTTRGELGYKPFTGWYAVATLGINIIKAK